VYPTEGRGGVVESVALVLFVRGSQVQISPHRLDVLTDFLWFFSTAGKCWKLSEILLLPIPYTAFPVSLPYPKVWVHRLVNSPSVVKASLIMLPLHDTVLFFPA
jgi:hypothetical protein